MARQPYSAGVPAGASGIPSSTMGKVHVIARKWALTRSLPTIETLWAAFLFEERRAGRLSNQASGGADLKALLAPFKNNLDELRALVTDSQTALGGRSRTTGHGVYSKARGLPSGPGGPGGEPEPVMGDLSSLGGPDSEDEDDVVRRLTHLTKKILGKKK